MDFSVEQVRMLASAERAMDRGKQPFVRDDAGRRWAFNAAVMAECGCESGQTASASIIMALMMSNLAALEAQIAIGVASSRPNV